MEFKNRISHTFLGIILILCITKVCHGQLMCYVCEDCEKISAQTPQFECNESFFNSGGPPNVSSVDTTTEHSTTTIENVTTSTDDAAQTTLNTTGNTEETTESKSTESTSKVSTENVTETTSSKSVETTSSKEIETTTQETTSTTEEQPPSPPTEGPPRNTTTVPTPPTPDTLKPLDDVENLNNRTGGHDQHVNKDEVEHVATVEQDTTKSYKPSADIRVRQQRSASDVSFHCFKVKATTANGTMIVNRGCSRVQTNESVCGQWESQHPLEKMNKCYPCSRTKCNGSSVLSVSITALFVAVTAVFMRQN